MAWASRGLGFVAAIALAIALSACVDGPEDILAAETTTTTAIATVGSSTTIANAGSSTTLPRSSLLEDRGMEELLALARSKGVDLGALAGEVGGAVEDLTEEQLIEAIRSLVIRATSKGCHGCWPE